MGLLLTFEMNMNYTFIEDRTEGGKTVKVFRNSQGSETKVSKIYTTQDGKDWFGFVDLSKIPYIRIAYSKHIMDLFNLGMGLKDLLEWADNMKQIIRSEDPEKYEKLYSLILEKEKLAKFTADPIKQHLALCTVYIIAEDERIDYFDEGVAEQKMKLWSADPEAITFFLSWHNERIQDYLNFFKKISRTVSDLQRASKPGPFQKS
jgi:hypothetical protein